MFEQELDTPTLLYTKETSNVEKHLSNILRSKLLLTQLINHPDTSLSATQHHSYYNEDQSITGFVIIILCA